MLGAIVGDVVGSRFEFNNTSQYDFDLFSTECEFTDDTICTIAIADALVSGKDYEERLRYWCKKYPYPMGGYGCSFRSWLGSKSPKPYNSFGNGSAMRVSPVAWWYDTLEDVKREARNTALPTHNHKEGVKGAVSVASAIFVLKNGSGKSGLIEIGNEYYPGFERSMYNAGGFDETCQGTVPLCFQIVSQSTSFEDAIRNAISVGGDSDTIGAIVGSMSEALWGIPEYIKDSVYSYLPSDMIEVLDRFNSQKNG